MCHQGSISLSRKLINWGQFQIIHTAKYATHRQCWALYLTHLPLDKMFTISQTTFSNAFPWMKIYKNFTSLFPRVPLIIFQHWFRWWFGADQATSHYLNQCWPSSPTHICGTRGRWVNFHSLLADANEARNHSGYGDRPSPFPEWSMCSADSVRWCYTVVSDTDEANLSRTSFDSSDATNQGPLPQYMDTHIIALGSH